MNERARETFLDLGADVRVRYRRSEPPPPLEYAITLETLIDRHWTTIALWDNADAPDEYHEHRYTRGQGKRPPSRLAYATTNAARAAAIQKAETQWQAILETWIES